MLNKCSLKYSVGNFFGLPIAMNVSVRSTKLKLVLISSNGGDFAPELRALFYGAPFNAVVAALTPWSLNVARLYSVAVILSRSAFGHDSEPPSEFIGLFITHKAKVFAPRSANWL